MQRIYIYCDESRHTFNDPYKFMVLGALWFKDSDKINIKETFKQLLTKYKYTSEIKWSRLSTRRFDIYKELISHLHLLPINFRAIIVDKSKVDLATYHNNSVPISHAKFIYYLIREVVSEQNSEYVILLDHKDRDMHSHISTINKFLAMHCLPSSKIIQLQEVVSKDNLFTQLVDLLIGAIGYDVNGIASSESKTELCKYIKDTYKVRDFKRTTSRNEHKFNIFNIILT